MSKPICDETLIHADYVNIQDVLILVYKLNPIKKNFQRAKFVFLSRHSQQIIRDDLQSQVYQNINHPTFSSVRPKKTEYDELSFLINSPTVATQQ